MKKIFSAILALSLVCTALLQKVYAEDELQFESVSYTAPITLHWLAKANVPEAVEFLGGLSAEDILNKHRIMNPARVQKANAVHQELCYTALNEYIDDAEYTTIVDLGCGVSPRGIKMVRDGKDYIGVELEAVTRAIESYTPLFLNDREIEHISFATADVTDREAMLAAVSNVQGKICIVEQGLAIFLTREQQKAMLENIHEMLRIHGGCFITTDYTTGEIFYEGATALYGREAAFGISHSTVKIYSDVANTDFAMSVFDTHEEAISFIKAQGFKVEKRPLFTDSKQFLYSVQDLSDAQIKKLRKVFKKKLLWVMTIDD